MSEPVAWAGTPGDGPAAGRVRASLLLGLFFVSGFAALVYQVLWVRELGLLFGSTAQAAALAIAIFFAGIASGGWFWGRRAPRLASSLRWFGLAEIGVAVTALGHFVLVDAYHALYPAMHAAVGAAPVFDTAAKAAVAATLLFPPAFLMGGTLPLMGQHLVRARDRLATTGTSLYAVNTAGSACGALAAGFVLPLALGFRGAYLLAVGLDLAVGISAVLLAGAEPSSSRITARRPLVLAALPAGPAGAACTGPSLPPGLVWVVAFASGFTTLAVEVVWTRLFSQVLQNSAYTYALVLGTFLVALAVGAGGAGLLSRIRAVPPAAVLGGLLALAAVASAVSPWLFHAATDGLAYVGSDLGWSGYVLTVAGTAVVVMFVPGAVMGAVLPYLLRLLESGRHQPGEAIGRLISANTAGAILGSLTAGFVLLPAVGAWRVLLLMAAVYLLLLAATVATAAPITATASRGSAPRLALTAAAGVTALGLVVTVPSGLDPMQLRAGERLVEARSGSHANVAVVAVDDEDNLAIRVNNYYTLGGSRSLDGEQNQTVVPLLTHTAPRSVFYLGMGTGITAGAALPFPVERVVVCELVPDVVTLAEAHFGPWTNGLFTDERVEIHAEDGRNCLRRSPERFDVIISDLFTPWKAGTGNLYTTEHYETARDRLEPGGLFAQWMPLYQLSEREFAIIAATMDEVFDEVTLWRGDLYATRSIVALVGRTDPEPLDPAVAVRHAIALTGDEATPPESYEALALRMYVGNITAGGLFSDAPRNTDDHPLVEYLAPRTHRAVRAGEAEFLVGGARERLYEQVRASTPLSEDPHLARLSPVQLDYVRAGHHYSHSVWLATQDRTVEARAERRAFANVAPAGTLRHTSPSRLLLQRPAQLRSGWAAPAGAP